MLDVLGANNIFVRYPEDLDNCEALIIPGGESTTISKQVDRSNLRDIIIEYAKTHPIFGTCAGMILLSSNEDSKNLLPLRILDFQVERNAWGRQLHSFEDELLLEFDEKDNFNAVFIRAPRISKIGKNIKVLASYKQEPVLLTDGRHIVSSFHPEIGSDYRIHQYFINKINV